MNSKREEKVFFSVKVQFNQGKLSWGKISQGKVTHEKDLKPTNWQIVTLWSSI
jgi:hypothetical protein